MISSEVFGSEDLPLAAGGEGEGGTKKKRYHTSGIRRCGRVGYVDSRFSLAVFLGVIFCSFLSRRYFVHVIVVVVVAIRHLTLPQHPEGWQTK